LARALATQCGLVHLDLDALARPQGFFPEEGISDEQWGSLFNEAYQQLATLLQSGKSVVFDAVNFDRVGRGRLRAIARHSDSSASVIYCKLSLQEIEQRRHANQTHHRRSSVRDQDFVELATEFETPTMEENVLIYDGTQSVPDWIKENNHCELHIG
jgi:predicted kinase